MNCKGLWPCTILSCKVVDTIIVKRNTIKYNRWNGSIIAKSEVNTINLRKWPNMIELLMRWMWRKREREQASERERDLCASAGVIQQAICLWCCVRVLAWGCCFSVGQPFVFSNSTDIFLFAYLILFFSFSFSSKDTKMLHLNPPLQKKKKKLKNWDLDSITLLVVIVTEILPSLNVCFFCLPRSVMVLLVWPCRAVVEALLPPAAPGGYRFPWS